MNYTDEQRAIIRRLDDISARVRDMAAAHRIAREEEVRDFADTITALHGAMNRSEEMLQLCTEHGEVFREFLATL